MGSSKYGLTACFASMPPACQRAYITCHADIFKERLGLVLEREDEINCAVGGCNFLLKTITHEAFTYSSEKGCQFVPCSCESLLQVAACAGGGAGCSTAERHGQVCSGSCCSLTGGCSSSRSVSDSAVTADQYSSSTLVAKLWHQLNHPNSQVG
jgi:hypothetical protein